MSLLLTIVNKPTSENFTFSENGGTIGRNGDSSWVLKDSKMIISGTHAKIEYENGAYFIIDVSTNGTFYNGKKLPKDERIRLKETDTLNIGFYQILISLDKEQYDDELSVLGIFEDDDKDEKKNIIEDDISIPKIEENPLIIPSDDDWFGSNPFEEPPKEVYYPSNNILEEDIIPPRERSNIKEIIPESKVEKRLVQRGEDTILLSILSSKLGVDIKSMDEKEQIRVISELADVICMTIDEVENLKCNIDKINEQLEIVTSKSHNKSRKEIFLLLKNPRELNEYLTKTFIEIKNHHTALYEATKHLGISLSQKFSPKNLLNEFRDLGKVKGWSSKQKDAQMWQEYSKKYSYIDKETNPYILIKELIVKKYISTLDTFELMTRG